MSLAIEEMREEDIETGKKIGLKVGKKEGKTEGIKIGEKRGEKRGRKLEREKMRRDMAFRLFSMNKSNSEVQDYIPGCSKYMVNKLRREWEAL